MATQPKKKRAPASIPQFGTIDGGPLHGWSYALVQVIFIGGVRHLDLRVTQPNWPFSKLVRFGPRSFKKLRAGLHAKRHDAKALLTAARELAKTGKN